MQSAVAEGSAPMTVALRRWRSMKSPEEIMDLILQIEAVRD